MRTTLHAGHTVDIAQGLRAQDQALLARMSEAERALAAFHNDSTRLLAILDTVQP